VVNGRLGVEKRRARTDCLALAAAHRTIVRREGEIICKSAEENFEAGAVGCDLVYGLVPWERSLVDREMELVEREVWRKRHTTRRVGKLAI
jgi:hypothetical protein